MFSDFVLNLIVLVILVPILIGVAIITITERRLLAIIQRRVGPNIVGVYGLGQPCHAKIIKL
jgi:NADH:ubiquinone oxidoreductase subunit H